MAKEKTGTSNGVSLCIDEEEEDFIDSEFWDEQNFRIIKQLDAEIAEELKRRKEIKNIILNLPDKYDICHFCKKYSSMDIYHRKGGLCSIKHNVVRIERKNVNIISVVKRKLGNLRKDYLTVGLIPKIE